MWPILLSIGPVNIYSFGVFLALAFVVTAFFIWREGRAEFKEELIFDALLLSAIFVLLGARLVYIFSHFPVFGFDLLRWVHFYLYPGFSFWGGVAGGLLSAFWFASRQKVPFLRLADFLVLGAALGQIFAQLGCFLDGCTVGRVTSLPWGLPALGFLEKRHPVAIYDLLMAIFIFLILTRVHHWIFRQKKQREGSIVLAYIAFLALFSFPLEFLKEGGLYFYNLNLNQWFALGFLTGTVVLGYRRWHNFAGNLLTVGFLKGKKSLIKKGGEKNDTVSGPPS